MDSLLAGTLILPLEGSLCRCDVQRRCAYKNIPGIAKAIPGSGENRSPSRRNHCSPSARNPVRLHPGIVFTFAPESFSPCPGIPTCRQRLSTTFQRLSTSSSVYTLPVSETRKHRNIFRLPGRATLEWTRKEFSAGFPRFFRGFWPINFAPLFHLGATQTLALQGGATVRFAQRISA